MTPITIVPPTYPNANSSLHPLPRRYSTKNPYSKNLPATIIALGQHKTKKGGDRLTAIEELKARLERVERGVLEHALCPKKLDELLDMQNEITDIREAFLSQPFTGNIVDVLEDMRFRILECEFNVHIFASEAMYQDIGEPMRRLTELYESIQ